MYNQNPNWGISELIGAIRRRNDERKESQGLERMTGLLNYSSDVQPTQTIMQDLSGRNNTGAQGNYLGSNIDKQTMQGLLPTGFQTNTPNANMIGQGLLVQQNQPQKFFNMPMYQTGNGQGIVNPGNIDLANRPTLKNADGSISTVRSMGVNIDGKEILLPTVGPNGEDWTEQQAMDYYKQTGKNLGTFDSAESSNKYAESLHNQQDQMYSNKTPLIGRYAKENNPVNVTTKSLSWKEAEMEHNKQWANQMKDAFKGMSPEMVKAYLPQVLSAKKEQLGQLKADYDKQAENKAWSAFDSAPDYKTKMMTGIKAGLNPQLLKMALDTGIDIKQVDLADRITYVGVDNHNNRVIDLSTGNVIDPSALNKGVSPTAIYNKETVSADTKYKIANAPPPRSGRTPTQKIGKEENWALGYESGNGLTNDTALIEGLSALDNPTPSQQIQLDKALGRRDHYWKVSSGGQYGSEQPQAQQVEQSNPGGAEWYYQQAEAIKAAHPDATMEQIEAFMTDKINRR